jgi:SNF2 family DNA or RNA helicase
MTTALPDAARMSREDRRKYAERVRNLEDIQPFPELAWFNSSPCEKHESLNILCRRCGVRLRRHQRIGSTWMYLGLPGLLSDTMGSGKTAQMCAMLAMCKQNGELGLHNRAVIVCRSAAVWDPWGNEIKRLLPGISVYVADGDRRQRIQGYMGNWEVAVVGDRTFAGAHGQKHKRDGDVALFESFPVGTLIYDDLDPMRNHLTETSVAVNRLAARCRRVHGAHATPTQKQLRELWCFLQPPGGRAALGSLDYFEMKYSGPASRTILTRDPGDKTGRRRVRKKVQVGNGGGITANPRKAEEFRRLIRPLVLRRTAKDIEGDVAMPAVQYNPVFLDLNPRQRTRYEELRRGTLRRLKETGEEVTRAQAAAAFNYGWQICSGLAALDEGPRADDSCKFDWLMNLLTGDLSDEKAVCFVYFKKNVAALAQRLKAEGIGGVLMWSGETDQRERARRLERFREDPKCRVLVGTTTIEASLNLQASRQVILVDTILNPARMSQIVGRCARVGSQFPTVYAHHLLARGTQEDAYLPMLRQEGEIADVVWDEKQSLFTALSPRQIMRLVAYGKL